MSHSSTVETLRQSVADVFDRLDRSFDMSAEERQFRPALRGWTVDEILEHVQLANHYLMITWRKAVATALRRAAEGEPVPEGESNLERLHAIREGGTFRWERPEHMTPHGRSSSAAVRAELRRQAEECLTLLEKIRDGEGALVRLHMSVNGLGRVDLYEWLFFLVQHARRHVRQIELVQNEMPCEPAAPEEGQAMTIDQVKQLVRRYIDEVWNRGDVAALEDLTTVGFEYRLGGQPARGRAAMAQFLAETRAAFPDWHVEIADLVVEGNLAAVRWHGQVTHAGPFRGIPATGRCIAVSGINLYHVSEGRIAAEWEQTDSLGMLQQMGVGPPR